MLVTIVAIWAVVIPIVILGVSWQAANRRDARAAEARGRSVPTHRQPVVPACVARAARPSRTTTRRVCPQLDRGARRRPASA
jgi:hypothetical protein